jgi:hypothetical protein
LAKYSKGKQVIQKPERLHLEPYTVRLVVCQNRWLEPLVQLGDINPHPLFQIIPGKIENWEKME